MARGGDHGWRAADVGLVAGQVGNVLHDRPMCEAGTALPAGFRFRQHRNKAEIGMLPGPAFGECPEIQILASARSPVERHRPRDPFGERMFDDRFDRCKTGAAGDKQHRLGRLLAQEEAALRSLDTQQVTLLQRAKDLSREIAPVDAPDVQLQARVVMWRIGQRKRAAAPVLEQDVDVLSGEEIEAFAGRQAEFDEHHVRRRQGQFVDASEQGAHGDVRRAACSRGLDNQVFLWSRATEQGETGGAFGLGQHLWRRPAVIDSAVQHLTPAAATSPVAATVGQQHPLAEGGVENALVRLRLERLLARFERDAKPHAISFVALFR